MLQQRKRSILADFLFAEALSAFGRHIPEATKGIVPLFFNGFLDGGIEGDEV
jgi:hypothetical protein